MEANEWIAKKIAESPTRITNDNVGYYTAVLEVYNMVGSHQFNSIIKMQAASLEANIRSYKQPTRDYGWINGTK